MYYYINGELTYRDANICVIDCGGVGYKLTVSAITSDTVLTKIGQRVKLFTHMAVREDGIELFGFGSPEERQCFNQLTSVSGIGPKAAMSILSVMTPEKLAMAVCSEDIKMIAKAPGIGQKTAARIVLELKDKMSKDAIAFTSSTKKSDTASAFSTASANLSEAAEALGVLGYDRSTVLGAIKGIDPSMDVGEIIRLALKKLSN